MNKKVLIIIVLIVAVAAASIFYFVRKAHKTENEMKELVEMMNFEKEQLEQEYFDLSVEFDNFPTNIKNDSLVKLLDNEKVKVQQLLEELRITKATNARRINELKNELATVRKIMVGYVAQIDSLNTLNTKLTKENTEVKVKYTEATRTVEQLSKEKETLSETVVRASKLDISNFDVKTLNAKDRATSRLTQIATMQFNYTVSKNITALPGMKTVYLRIKRPDGEVLTKGTGNVFKFEDKNIEYSSKKEIEYEGEAVSDVVYWKVEEILQSGKYRADFFIDGNLVGSFPFEIKK